MFYMSDFLLRWLLTHHMLAQCMFKVTADSAHLLALPVSNGIIEHSNSNGLHSQFMGFV